MLANKKIYCGFSLVEVILAVAIFSILAVTGITTILHSFSLNKFGGEISNAHYFAQEGIEAARSIKNKSWSSMVPGSYGFTTTGNQWGLLAPGTFETKGKYTRQLVLSNVNRNVSGNIVDSGGSVDPDTMKATVNVDWDYSESRTGNVLSLVTYLTNFRKAISTLGNALLIYGDGTTIPKYKIYDSITNTFSSASNSLEGSVGHFFSLRTSPSNTEAISGYVSSSGNLQIVCFDGTSWSNEWSVNVGGSGTTRRFDISYETNSGDVVVVYSTNSAAANALAYRVKSGSSGCGSANWSAPANFSGTPSVTTGIVHWVRLARDVRTSSNAVTAIWADSNADLGVNNWSGSAWANGSGTYKVLETNLERKSSPQDIESFEIVYESMSGDAMVVWGIASGANGTNGARFSTCNGGVYTCSWTAVAAVPTVSDDVHNLDMSANPNSNQIAYAAIGDAGDDLTAAYWNGSAWTGYANLDTTTESPIAGSKLVSTAWLVNGSVTKWILNYDDASGTGLSWYEATPGNTPSRQNDFNTTPSINDIRERYDADTDPVNKNQAIITVTDSTRLLFAKRINLDSSGGLTWSNADGGTSLGTTTSIPQQSFAFQFWRNP